MGIQIKLKLHDLKPAAGSKKKPIRVGRGEGGRRGKTAGRGTKGSHARNTIRPGFEGGQMPLARRIPKLKGFTNPSKELFAIVNVGELGGFPSGSLVTPELLRQRGLVKHRGRIKLLAEGTIDRPLTLKIHAVSAAAQGKIEAAGGSVEMVEA